MIMSPRLFRVLIVSSWVMSFVGSVAHFMTQHALPADLVHSLTTYRHEPQNAVGPVRLAIDLVFIVLWVAVSVGLYLFQNWARLLRLLLIPVGMLLLNPTQLIVDFAWVTVLQHLPYLMDGIVLAVAYFSPLSERFSGTAEK